MLTISALASHLLDIHNDTPNAGALRVLIENEFERLHREIEGLKVDLECSHASTQLVQLIRTIARDPE